MSYKKKNSLEIEWAWWIYLSPIRKWTEEAWGGCTTELQWALVLFSWGKAHYVLHISFARVLTLLFHFWEFRVWLITAPSSLCFVRLLYLVSEPCFWPLFIPSHQTPLFVLFPPWLGNAKTREKVMISFPSLLGFYVL